MIELLLSEVNYNLLDKMCCCFFSPKVKSERILVKDLIKVSLK